MGNILINIAKSVAIKLCNTVMRYTLNLISRKGLLPISREYWVGNYRIYVGIS